MNEIVKISLDIEIIYYLQKSFIISYNDWHFRTPASFWRPGQQIRVIRPGVGMWRSPSPWRPIPASCPLCGTPSIRPTLLRSQRALTLSSRLWPPKIVSTSSRIPPSSSTWWWKTMDRPSCRTERRSSWFAAVQTRSTWPSWKFLTTRLRSPTHWTWEQRWVLSQTQILSCGSVTSHTQTLS